MSKNLELTNEQPILVEISEQDKMLAPYLNGRAYDKNHIIEETKIWLKQHVTSGYEIGRRLIVLKTRCDYGEFQSLIESEFNLSRQHAYSLMSLARMIVEINGKSGGKISIEKLEEMDQKKIQVLGQIIPEYKEELEELGTIGGRTIDQYDAMTRKQLTDLVKSHTKTIENGKQETVELRKKLIEKTDKVEELLSATPNVVSEAVSRLQLEINNILAAFDNTCKCDALLPEATALNLVALKTQARSFAQAVCNIIDNRFEQIHDIEVPSDEDVHIPEIVSEIPKSKSKKS